jgi:hypothetical protein
MFYEGLYLYQKTGVNTARTLYTSTLGNPTALWSSEVPESLWCRKGITLPHLSRKSTSPIVNTLVVQNGIPVNMTVLRVKQINSSETPRQSSYPFINS